MEEPLKIVEVPQEIIDEHKLTEKQTKFISLFMGGQFQNNLHSYKKAFPDAKMKDEALKCKAYRLKSNPKIVNACADIMTRANKNEITGEQIITVAEVIYVLKDILKNDFAEHRDRIKSAELLLKHLDGFKSHNTSKASKSLTIISEKSSEDLLLDLQNMINLPDEHQASEYTISQIQENVNEWEEMDDFEEI